MFLISPLKERKCRMPLAQVSLDDKYVLETGRVYLTGTQALVRLPMMQRQRDKAAGIETGGFISGYRGSPLGLYDNALSQARRFLEKNRIHFQPGVNEDLAATAVWGSQQVGMFPGAEVQGVFGIWYGKGPGVDRSVDVLKHGNSAGSSKYGGVLVLMGDDHGCQSSTLAHQSEQVLQAAMIPVLNPASVQDYLEFGLTGFALSRFSGCWIGFKAISEAVESSASISVDPHQVEIRLPSDFEMPPGGLNIRWPDPPLDQERRLHGPKMQAVLAFARLNRLDRIVIDAKPARLGIAATGKAYLDVRQALDDLGLDEAGAAALGIRLYKIGLSWPLEPEGARDFARGLEEVLVVEEKRAFVEDQLAKLLYHLPTVERPRLVGKTDEQGRVLLPSEGELAPGRVAHVIAERLIALHGELPELRRRLMRLDALARREAEAQPLATRTPFFCSGCPHNTSTRVPEGSRAIAGIGCHSMAIFQPARRTETWTHMGGEGATWIGQAPFTSERHVFQNLGDGTYFHSGLLAIRAAAAAGVNITYKILFNDAVAMTGGQKVDGHLTVPELTHQVWSEGAKRVVVVADDPDKYPLGTSFAPGTEIRPREELDQVQRELRETSGLTILVYDQTCAAEKRRRRKRGRLADPPERVFINDLVCEGCGDCSTQSNCVSVKPLETEFGRKRVIDQSNCNKDYSCLKGFCPSFVTVSGATLRKAAPAPALQLADPFADLPLPAPAALDRPYGILVTGIGGTGVITVGALLGMAAHLEGKGVSVLDFTGLSQKNGAVMSHVRLAPSPGDLHAVRIGPGGSNLLLGCDMVVAASPAALGTVEGGATRAVVNAALTPTAEFVTNGDMDLKDAAMQRTLRDATQGQADFVDATGLATALMGDAIATNLFMLGYAFQKGLVPLSLGAIEQAIELNGVGVGASKRTFAWGRLAAHDLARVEAAARPARRAPEKRAETLPEIVERRAAFLAEYQDQAYADRYRRFVAEIEAAEKERARGRTGLAEAVARNLFKLMAYKDEYEVARLHADPAFEQKLRAQFDGDFKLQFHLAPPLLAERDPVTGELKKRRYGAWMLTAFRLLARMKRLRGTAFDVFGRTEERRTERRLIGEYEATMRGLLPTLGAANYATAVAIARIPEQIRGFGHVKDRNLAAAKTREAELLVAFRRPAAELAPATAAE
jgi:indolepyruvate ferredoxin oxidoreductase